MVAVAETFWAELERQTAAEATRRSERPTLPKRMPMPGRRTLRTSLPLIRCHQCGPLLPRRNGVAFSTSLTGRERNLRRRWSCCGHRRGSCRRPSRN